MKSITKYVSEDGVEFDNEQACAAYEKTCAQVRAVMAPLGIKPDLPGCGFANGDGYLQHRPTVVASVRADLLAIADSIMPHRWFKESAADPSVHPSWAGRMIDEMQGKCLREAWYRFMCMTPDGREYGQPYYANNPDQAKDVRLN